jgi:hypothetical protein
VGLVKALHAVLLAATLLEGCGGIGASGPGSPPVQAAAGAIGSEGDARGEYRGGSVDPAISIEEFEIDGELPRSSGASRAAARASGRLRLTVDGIVAGGGGGKEGHAALSSPRFRIVLRRRETAAYTSTAGFARLETIAGFLALAAGSFVPDFAEGLIAGGAGSPHVFSGAFPMASRRRIAPNTSSYGRALIGGAIEIGGGACGGVLFAGRERIVRSGRLEAGPARVAGGRVETRAGGFRGGMSLVAKEGDGRKTLVGADARFEAGNARAGFEAVHLPGGFPAALAAFSFRGRTTSAGVSLYSATSGAGGIIGRVNGVDIGFAPAYGGAIAAAERKVARGTAVRAALECAARTGDEERKERWTIRAEIERKWRRIRLVLSGNAAGSGETPLLPFPGGTPSSRDSGGGAGALVVADPGSSVSIRLAVKSVAKSHDERGVLVSPMLRVRSPGGRVVLTAFHAVYAASRGAPACYYYEPSLAGAYPWRGAYRDLSRSAFIISIKYNKIEASGKVAYQLDAAAEGSVQAVAAF